MPHLRLISTQRDTLIRTNSSVTASTAPITSYNSAQILNGWREKSLADKLQILAMVRPSFLQVVTYAADSMLTRLENQGSAAHDAPSAAPPTPGPSRGWQKR